MGEFPNKATQFSKTNQPKNSGRKHGSLSLKTWIEKVWNEEITEDNGNKIVRILLSVKALVKKAEEGDVGAFKALVERVEGLPTQKIETTEVQRLIQIDTADD